MFSTDEKLLPYRALPVGFIDSLSEHLFYINFPMPFHSARIVILNERAETLPATIEIALRESLPGTENARLHAFYGQRRVERREDEGDNYSVIDVEGRGKYLGMILNAWDLDREALNGPLIPIGAFRIWNRTSMFGSTIDWRCRAPASRMISTRVSITCKPGIRATTPNTVSPG